MAMSSACLPIFRCSTKRRSRFRRSPDRKSTRLNSSHSQISYAVFCLKKKTTFHQRPEPFDGVGVNVPGPVHAGAALDPFVRPVNVPLGRLVVDVENRSVLHLAQSSRP